MFYIFTYYILYIYRQTSVDKNRHRYSAPAVMNVMRIFPSFPFDGEKSSEKNLNAMIGLKKSGTQIIDVCLIKFFHFILYVTHIKF